MKQCSSCGGFCGKVCQRKNEDDDIQVYQRPWVGLEKKDMPDGEDPMYDHPFFIAGMVYAANKLREKNT